MRSLCPRWSIVASSTFPTGPSSAEIRRDLPGLTVPHDWDADGLSRLTVWRSNLIENNYIASIGSRP